MSVEKQHSSPENPGSGARESTGISMMVDDFSIESQRKFGEVSNLILTASGKEFQKYNDDFQSLVERWLNHPIFRDVKSLTASAIFAKGFGKVLCTANLAYISSKVENIDIKLSSEAISLAGIVASKFSGDPELNKGIHNRLVALQEGIKVLIGNDEDEKRIIAICSSLIDQIEGEIATNTITQLNGNADVYRSHYFDFIEAMETSSPDANELYKGDTVDVIEVKYIAGLKELLEKGGDDAVTAVTLLSEGFIRLTYKIIQKYVVHSDKVQEQGRDELNNFYKGHIELDGADTTDAEDTHLAMVKGMLSKVENRDKFMDYCKQFVALRQEVHDSLMNVS